MVTVTIAGDSWHVKMEGHAGYDEAGRDIVCAACSTLMYQAAACAMEMESIGALADAPYIRLEPGDSEVVAHPLEDYGILAEGMMKTVEIGFTVISQQYPDYVRIEYIGNGESR